MGRRGDRQGACKALVKRYRRNQDPQALRIAARFALEKPPLKTEASEIIQTLVAHRGLSEMERQQHRQSLKGLLSESIGDEPAYY